MNNPYGRDDPREIAWMEGYVAGKHEMYERMKELLRYGEGDEEESAAGVPGGSEGKA